MSVVARELLPEDAELERSLRPKSLDDFVGQERTKEQLSIALEAAMTALLMAVILLFVASARRARWTPLAIWPLIALLVWSVGSYTGTSLNPTRSAAPALVFGNLSSLWLYLVAPTAGAVAVAWQRLQPEAQPKTAKLFHDARYPCSLASELPAMPPAAQR